MATRLSVNEAKTRLSEYLKRFVVERHGKPVGALVSLEDLERLEERSPLEPEDGAAKEEAFWRKMEESGLLRSRRKGPRQLLPPFDLIEAEGGPISEDILADREYRDRLLTGQ
jgi:prevent-host-death family protein